MPELPEPGGAVWVRSDALGPASVSDPFILATLGTGDAGKGSVFVKVEGHDQQAVPSNAVWSANTGAAANGLPENTQLPHLSPAALLHNLTVRSIAEQPYTYTGKIVLSVNPCKPMPHLTDEVR